MNEIAIIIIVPVGRIGKDEIDRLVLQCSQDLACIAMIERDLSVIVVGRWQAHFNLSKHKFSSATVAQ